MRRLPEPAARASATVVGITLSAFRRDARAMHAVTHVACSRQNAERERGESVGETRFSQLRPILAQGARLPAVPPQVVLDRFVVESGYEYLVENMAAGHGVLMALPHVGSWEWGGAWLALNGYPMTSVAEPVEPHELYEWFVSQREAMGLRILPLGQGVSSVVR